jgi:hypothetical protein
MEEVGTGPLMEELGLDEATAQRVVDRCSEEAKIVAVEQEAKKAADAKAKAADKAALLALGNVAPEPVAEPIAPDAAATEAVAAEPAAAVEIDSDEKMPGSMEAVPGASAEVTVHNSQFPADAAELAPEEQAISGLESPEQRNQPAVEESETAALAEGRESAPGSAQGEV